MTFFHFITYIFIHKSVDKCMDNPVENYNHNYVDIHTLQTDNKN
jgi:hypothetical protein